MMKTMAIRSGLVALAMLAGACQAQPQAGLPEQTVTLQAPDGKELAIRVEVAATDGSREVGLMERRHMDGDRGMLFVWPEPLVAKFWMKNTYIPLDMLFFRDGALVGEVRGAKPLNETAVGPDAMVDSVLEVNAGFMARHGIGPGWRLVVPQ